MKNNKLHPDLSLREWIEKFNTLKNPPKIEVIKKYFKKNNNTQDELYVFFYKKYCKEIKTNEDSYLYKKKYIHEENKKSIKERIGKTFKSLLHWNRINKNNMEHTYMKIAKIQDEVKRFILNNSETKDDGIYLYIKKGENNSDFAKLLELVDSFVKEYIENLELRNIKNKDSIYNNEKQLNEAIDIVNKILYIKDKDSTMIPHIKIKDKKELKKELTKQINELSLIFEKDTMRSLSAFINRIIDIIEPLYNSSKGKGCTEISRLN